MSEVHTAQRSDRQKGPQGSDAWVSVSRITRSTMNMPFSDSALESESVNYSVHNKHVCSRDSTVRHMHTPFGAVVARIRTLAVRRERGSEVCVTQKLGFELLRVFAEPCIEFHT